MRDASPISPSVMAADAVRAAALMKVLSNERRLLILCHLIEDEEMGVGTLAARIGISQSALSQHLAKLRDEGLVSFRREAQNLFYRVSDDRAATVLRLLHDLFCANTEKSVRQSPMVKSPSPRKNRVKGG